jgi:uncharacterized protein YoxC
MTPAAVWVLVALAAVLVGFAIPSLLQLRRTLKAAEQTLESTGRQLNQTLDQLTATLERVGRTADELERGVTRVKSLLDALGGVGDALGKIRSSVLTVTSIGSIVGSALLAALGLRSRESKAEPEEAREPLEQGEQVR